LWPLVLYRGSTEVPPRRTAATLRQSVHAASAREQLRGFLNRLPAAASKPLPSLPNLPHVSWFCDMCCARLCSWTGPSLQAAPSIAQKTSFPDLGPKVRIFDPVRPVAEMQAEINRVYATEQHSEFGPDRHAFLFLPGEYHLDIPVGFYMEVRGLGATPDAVHITGNVHADASLPKDNATCVFWRGVENFAVTPRGGGEPEVAPDTMRWAVSQAVPMRRMHIEGYLVLHQNHDWASGGWMADTLVDGIVDSGTQQQWISRNSDWAGWTGSNWNMVFVGVPHMPAGTWPKPAYTEIAQTPMIREKPFLRVYAAGKWSVRVPGIRIDSAGITWRGLTGTDTPGRDIPIEQFYIAHPGRDTAASINIQLAAGKQLLLTPGIYELSEPIRVMKPGTVVLGRGFATLRPTNGTAAMITADVDGLTIAGLLFDGGPQISPVLLEVGAPGSHLRHRTDPILLADVFFRVGGAGVGRTVENLEVNANDTIIDHTWIWRADHGAHVGWTENPSQNGLVVNGDNAIAYGLFVEHHQQFHVIWNGERGRTYMYQSEIPYDPPNQAAYSSALGTDGWASYKLASTVLEHEAWGLGIYSVFTNPNIFLTRAIEVPDGKDVRFHDMITTCLNDYGGIRNIINDAGGTATCHPRHSPRLTMFP